MNNLKNTASYYIYSDGSAYWGLSLYRNGELPLECTTEQYVLDQSKRAEWFATRTIEIEKKALEAKKK